MTLDDHSALRVKDRLKRRPAGENECKIVRMNSSYRSGQIWSKLWPGSGGLTVKPVPVGKYTTIHQDCARGSSRRNPDGR